MEIQIWIVNTCIPEEGEKPCIPSPFGTAAEAEAYADEMMRGEWESSRVEDDDGEPVEYPGDWRAAQERLVEWNGPGWGTWEITTHKIPIATNPSRIAITVSGGVAELADAENWPEGLSLYIVDYDCGDMDDEELSQVEGPCTISTHTSPYGNMTGHFASKVAEAWQHD